MLEYLSLAARCVGSSFILCVCNVHRLVCAYVCGQVAEGVATAGVVVSLARKYKVSLPVLTAVAQVLDNAITPSEAVSSIMNLPQIEER